MAASQYSNADSFSASLQGQMDALKALIPTPSQVMPVGVADVGVAGSDPTKYSIEGHTHASKARKQRVLGVTAATYTWTYPTPFDTGVTPICNAIVEDPANSATDSYNVQVVGKPTNTQAVFRIIRQSAGIIGLSALSLSFNPTPGTVNLHLTALEP
jgi:hypothetical protein